MSKIKWDVKSGFVILFNVVNSVIKVKKVELVDVRYWVNLKKGKVILGLYGSISGKDWVVVVIAVLCVRIYTVNQHQAPNEMTSDLNGSGWCLCCIQLKLLLTYTTWLPFMS